MVQTWTIYYIRVSHSFVCFYVIYTSFYIVFNALFIVLYNNYYFKLIVTGQLWSLNAKLILLTLLLFLYDINNEV